MAPVFIAADVELKSTSSSEVNSYTKRRSPRIKPPLSRSPGGATGLSALAASPFVPRMDAMASSSSNSSRISPQTTHEPRNVPRTRNAVSAVSSYPLRFLSSRPSPCREAQRRGLPATPTCGDRAGVALRRRRHPAAAASSAMHQVCAVLRLCLRAFVALREEAERRCRGRGSDAVAGGRCEPTDDAKAAGTCLPRWRPAATERRFADWQRSGHA
jgi:hypothetical protein